MNLPRYAQRRDANEPAIVQALQDLGADVYRMGKPCDLLVRWQGRLHLLEVDNPQSRYRKRDSNQLLFLRQWHVPMVRTVDDAFRAIGASTCIGA